MNDAQKTKKQLLNELAQLRQEVVRFQTSENNHHEELFRRLCDNIPSGYQLLDKNGRLVAVNQSWLEALGYAHDEVIGRWFGDFLAPDSRKDFIRYLSHLQNTDKSRGVELEIVRQDGTQIVTVVDSRIEYEREGNFKQNPLRLS